MTVLCPGSATRATVYCTYIREQYSTHLPVVLSTMPVPVYLFLVWFLFLLRFLFMFLFPSLLVFLFLFLSLLVFLFLFLSLFVFVFLFLLPDVVLHYKRAWGIRFMGLNPVNEPLAHWWTGEGAPRACVYRTVRSSEPLVH